MERTSSSLEVILKHAGDQDEDKDLKKRMDEIREQFDEKEEDLEAMKQLNNDLIVKEKTSSNELYQARMELIEVPITLFFCPFPGLIFFFFFLILKSIDML